MNWLDLLLLLLILLSTVAGFLRGFIRIGIGFAATLLGFVLAAWFYGLAANVLMPYVASKAVAGFLGFLSIFAAVILAGAVLSFLLAKFFHKVGLSWLDRLLGGVFGFARGVLVAIIILMLTAAFSSQPPPAAIVESALAPHFIDVSQMLSALTPNEIKAGFRKTQIELQKMWKEAIKNKKSKQLERHEI